jgi:hypothetical protein
MEIEEISETLVFNLTLAWPIIQEDSNTLRIRLVMGSFKILPWHLPSEISSVSVKNFRITSNLAKI